MTTFALAALLGVMAGAACVALGSGMRIGPVQLVKMATAVGITVGLLAMLIASVLESGS